MHGRGRLMEPRFYRGLVFGLALAVPLWVGVLWIAVKMS